MKQIIFVCTGNTCRSPMAEVIAKSLCKNTNLNIYSRGIFVPQNTNASNNSMEVVKKYNLSLKNHISTQLTKEEIENATLILTMTLEHKQIICQNFQKYKNKIYTLYEYTENLNKNIQDPFGLSLKSYSDCFDEIFNLINKIDFNNLLEN